MPEGGVSAHSLFVISEGTLLLGIIDVKRRGERKVGRGLRRVVWQLGAVGAG